MGTHRFHTAPFLELLKKRELIKEYIPGKFAELGSRRGLWSLRKHEHAFTDAVELSKLEITKPVSCFSSQVLSPLLYLASA